MHKTIWINKKFITWESSVETSSICPHDSVNRAYELWNHANEILTKHATQDFLADAISNLNKVIQLRVKSLNENYSFSNSPFKAKDKKIYSQLEEFAILRPRLINEIVKFRNNIEHNDKKPPTLGKCLDFLEVCWYFLKATDLLVLYINHGVVFTNTKTDNYWIETEIDFSNSWDISVRGWITPSQTSFIEHKDFIKVDIVKYETRKEFAERMPGESKSLNSLNDGRGEKPEDICFGGKLSPRKEDLKEIMKVYFSVVR